MEATTATVPKRTPQLAIRTLLRGVGQVMFQESAWTGLLFLAGIFWGAFASGTPEVAWGCIAGVGASTVTGCLLGEPMKDGEAGLWGFNGALVGCAFPTFLGTGWLMWISLVFCAALTTIVRRGFNNVMAAWKINSLTFPFVFCTWLFLLSAREFMGLPQGAGEGTPELPGAIAPALDAGFGDLVVYWLKGISQVFLVDNWVTGIFFLAALAVCNLWSCFWAAVASAISLGVACLFHATGTDISSGLYGFSAVLTGIAVGSTFYHTNWRVAAWTVMAIVATVFVQAAMNAFLAPLGIATLTGPFCITTWLFLLPCFKFNAPEPDHSSWHKAGGK